MGHTPFVLKKNSSQRHLIMREQTLKETSLHSHAKRLQRPRGSCDEDMLFAVSAGLWGAVVPRILRVRRRVCYGSARIARPIAAAVASSRCVHNSMEVQVGRGARPRRTTGSVDPSRLITQCGVVWRGGGMRSESAPVSRRTGRRRRRRRYWAACSWPCTSEQPIRTGARSRVRSA